jgi:hypothetical protein
VACAPGCALDRDFRIMASEVAGGMPMVAGNSFRERFAVDGAAGFPSKSGAEAFVQLRREYPDSPLSILAASAQGLEWKSKDAATGWSVVPGRGQVYVGRYRQGSVHLLVALAAGTMMVAPLVVAYERRNALLQIGSHATITGNAIVNANAFMQDNATVAGNLTLAGVLQHQNIFTIAGTLTQNAMVTIPSLVTHTVTAGTGTTPSRTMRRSP